MEIQFALINNWNPDKEIIKYLMPNDYIADILQQIFVSIFIVFEAIGPNIIDIRLYFNSVNNTKMYLMNSTQRENQMSKAYRNKLIKDCFKVASLIVGLKCISYLVTKDSWSMPFYLAKYCEINNIKVKSILLIFSLDLCLSASSDLGFNLVIFS